MDSILKLTREYVENQDCSCADSAPDSGRCWYHMTYLERVHSVAQYVCTMLDTESPITAQQKIDAVNAAWVVING